MTTKAEEENVPIRAPRAENEALPMDTTSDTDVVVPHGDIMTDVIVDPSEAAVNERSQALVGMSKGESSSTLSIDKGEAKNFVVESRLCFPDRDMTVEDFAIHDAKVARAIITCTTLPRDRESLQHEDSADLEMQGFRCLVEAGLHFSKLGFKRLQELRKAKAVKKQRNAEIKKLNTEVAGLLELADLKSLFQEQVFGLQKALDALEVERKAKESIERSSKDVVVKLNRIKEEHNSAIAQDGPAKLLDVAWLEITATKKIDLRKSYQIGFKVSFRGSWYPLYPFFIMAKIQDGNYIARKVNFQDKRPEEEFDAPDNFVIRFSPRDHSSEPILHMTLCDHWTAGIVWKSGLHIHHAFVKELN
ncbi:hypothetical protein LguiA_025668 [Lonicera macranthoides]